MGITKQNLYDYQFQNIFVKLNEPVNFDQLKKLFMLYNPDQTTDRYYQLQKVYSYKVDDQSIYLNYIFNDTSKKRGIQINFKTYDLNLNRKQVLYKEGSDDTDGIELYIQNGVLKYRIWSKQTNWSGSEQTINEQLEQNKWYVVVLNLDQEDVLQNDVFKLYLNGELKGSTLGKQLKEHQDIYIGNDETKTNQLYGEVVGFYIYERIITDEEIEKNKDFVTEFNDESELIVKFDGRDEIKLLKDKIVFNNGETVYDFIDYFDRQNSSSLGNGWIEQEGTDQKFSLNNGRVDYVTSKLHYRIVGTVYRPLNVKPPERVNQTFGGIIGFPEYTENWVMEMNIGFGDDNLNNIFSIGFRPRGIYSSYYKHCVNIYYNNEVIYSGVTDLYSWGEYKIDVEVKGKNIKVYINGQMKVDHTHTDYIDLSKQTNLFFGQPGGYHTTGYGYGNSTYYYFDNIYQNVSGIEENVVMTTDNLNSISQLLDILHHKTCGNYDWDLTEYIEGVLGKDVYLYKNLFQGIQVQYELTSETT